MDGIAALTSFLITFAAAVPVFMLAWIALRFLNRRAERMGGYAGNPGPAVSAAVCVIQALAVLAAFPVVLYFLSGGQGRGEASMIVSLLFLVPLGIVAAAGAAATLLRIARREKEGSPRPED